jgi:peptidoglycan/LPS O-acetylase OafA/YrhL
MHSFVTQPERIGHLDAIRFVAAVWVALSHGAVALKPLFQDPLARLLAGGVSASFNGTSAVMVFFIVSGMCIHLPYARSSKVPAVRFLVRRYCRIGIPLLAVLVITSVVGPRAVGRQDGVLWSVYAELVYYSIYPLLFIVAQRIGWTPLLIVSGAVSVCLTIGNLQYMIVPEFGWLCWIWGLPVWLSGCLLADRLCSGRLTHSEGGSLAWRVAAWSIGTLTTILVFHSTVRIGYPVSMLGFSVFAYFWLQAELQNPFPAWRWLERCGGASYSLYLVHSIVLAIVDDTSLTPLVADMLRSLGILIATFVFYTAVEAPSHRLARYLASRISLNREPPQPQLLRQPAAGEPLPPS